MTWILHHIPTVTFDWCGGFVLGVLFLYFVLWNIAQSIPDEENKDE